MKSNRIIIDEKYWSLYKNKNLANIVKTYNVKFAKEKININTYLDSVAYKYYGDESLWWVIAIFNNIVDPILDLDNRSYLLIPLNVNNYVDKL